jgi:hypothetical protein
VRRAAYAERMNQGTFRIGHRDRLQIEAQIAEDQKQIAKHPLALVSLYDTLVRLQRWVFGLETQWSAILPSMIVVVSVTLFAWFILLRNVSAPLRV